MERRGGGSRPSLVGPYTLTGLSQISDFMVVGLENARATHKNNIVSCPPPGREWMQFFFNIFEFFIFFPSIFPSISKQRKNMLKRTDFAAPQLATIMDRKQTWPSTHRHQ